MIQHQIDVRMGRHGVVARRDFLRAIGFGAAGLALGWTDQVGMAAEALQASGKRCILLWMEGGPSQFETLDPKPASGSADSIATNVPGIHLSENLPKLAQLANEMAIIRSMTSKEGSHPRAQYLMHHGYLPMGGVKFPTLGSNVAEQIGNAACELPSFVRIGGRGSAAGNAGFLGVDYDPLVLANATSPPRNARPVSSTKRYERRLGLLSQLESDFGAVEGADVVADHRRLVDAASEMILSPSMQAFDIEKEPESVRKQYGEGTFGSGCLLARRLLEAGATFIEVTQNGWDTHKDNHQRVANNCAQVDRGVAALLQDLKSRGMLESTLVIWMGEFGRTPKINAQAGRDHYPRAFSSWLAGCGVQGGQVIGATNENGSKVIERPVTPKDLYQTIYSALGIDPEYENMSRTNRPIKLVDEGSPVTELFS